MTIVTPELVDGLGMIAGAIWMSSALYLQFIRSHEVEARFVAAVFLIGVAIMLGSSAIALGGSSAAALAALIGNVVFAVLGLGIWIGLASTGGD